MRNNLKGSRQNLIKTRKEPWFAKKSESCCTREFFVWKKRMFCASDRSDAWKNVTCTQSVMVFHAVLVVIVSFFSCRPFEKRTLSYLVTRRTSMPLKMKEHLFRWLSHWRDNTDCQWHFWMLPLWRSSFLQIKRKEVMWKQSTSLTDALKAFWWFLALRNRHLYESL